MNCGNWNRGVADASCSVANWMGWHAQPGQPKILEDCHQRAVLDNFSHLLPLKFLKLLFSSLRFLYVHQSSPSSFLLLLFLIFFFHVGGFFQRNPHLFFVHVNFTCKKCVKKCFKIWASLSEWALVRPCKRPSSGFCVGWLSPQTRPECLQGHELQQCLLLWTFWHVF